MRNRARDMLSRVVNRCIAEGSPVITEQRELHVDKLATVARSINNSRGYGDIKECRMFLDGRVELIIRRPYMNDTTRRGTFRNGKLTLMGTTRVVK